jgi:hypothetical protein
MTSTAASPIRNAFHDLLFGPWFSSELTAQVDEVNHSKLGKRTFQFRLAADAVAALLARS